jgi:hypothetical protein
MNQISVDTGHHIITDIRAYHTDKKDNQYLQDISSRLQQRLWKQGLYWENIVAYTGYSSGENYAFLETKGIRSFISPNGTYKGDSEGFTYAKEWNHYLCTKGKFIPFKKVFFEYRTITKKKEYQGSSKICKDCPLKATC